MRKKKSCDSLRTTTTFLRTLTKKKFSQLGVDDIMTEFFMAMIPPTTTAQQHKVAVVNGKPKYYDPPELKVAKAKLKDNLIPHIPDKAYDGPLRLITKWCFPITGNHSDGEYKYTKPDTDDLIKALKDIMEELGFFVNDSRIASEINEKFWAKIPGIYIKIEELD